MSLFSFLFGSDGDDNNVVYEENRNDREQREHELENEHLLKHLVADFRPVRGCRWCEDLADELAERKRKADETERNYRTLHDASERERAERRRRCEQELWRNSR